MTFIYIYKCVESDEFIGIYDYVFCKYLIKYLNIYFYSTASLFSHQWVFRYLVVRNRGSGYCSYNITISWEQEWVKPEKRIRVRAIVSEMVGVRICVHAILHVASSLDDRDYFLSDKDGRGNR